MALLIITWTPSREIFHAQTPPYWIPMIHARRAHIAYRPNIVLRLIYCAQSLHLLDRLLTHANCTPCCIQFTLNSYTRNDRSTDDLKKKKKKRKRDDEESEADSGGSRILHSSLRLLIPCPQRLQDLENPLLLLPFFPLHRNQVNRHPCPHRLMPRSVPFPVVGRLRC